MKYAEQILKILWVLIIMWGGFIIAFYNKGIYFYLFLAILLIIECVGLLEIINHFKEGDNAQTRKHYE